MMLIGCDYQRQVRRSWSMRREKQKSFTVDCLGLL